MSAFTEEMGKALREELQRSFLIQRELLDVLRDMRDINAQLRDELREFKNLVQKWELKSDLGKPIAAGASGELVTSPRDADATKRVEQAKRVKNKNGK